MNMKSLLCIFISITMLSCSEGTISELDVGQKDEAIYRVENVKLINARIENPRDKSTRFQKSYPINLDSRLLMGYYNFSQYLSQINQDYPVKISIHLVNPSQSDLAKEHLALCPVQSQWMPLATWSKAHPFKNGSWNLGGDLEAESCFKPIDDASCENAICFNINPWLDAYIIQSNGQSNFGWALTSLVGEIIQIYGDASPSKGPRVSWMKKATTP